MKNKDKTKQLKEYFEKRDDIAFAFLFGSRTNDNVRSESDWDIAVYFKPLTGGVEFEAGDIEYEQESRVWGDLVTILKTDQVDLVILNNTPASIADSALQGVPIVVKDRGLWLDFMLIITNLAENYRAWAHDYYQIVQRSQSLSPRDRERLERLVNFTEKQFELYPIYRQFSWQDFEQDLRKRNEIERWLENIVNAVIDMAKVVVGSKKFLTPPTYREAVRAALSVLKMPDDLDTKFEKWVSLRNNLAHEYLDIKWKKLADFTNSSEPLMKKFVSVVKEFLKNSR